MVILRRFTVVAGVVEVKHPHASWIAGLFKALVEATEDLDTAVPQWLREGAPAGFRVPIPPGPYAHASTDPPQGLR